MNDLFLKPAPGKSVRDPRSMKLLAAMGERKLRNSYWLRRLAAGDVIEVVQKTKGKAK